MYLRTTASLFALALLSTPALADEAPLKQPGRWAQDYTGRKADPAVLFGTLPNGLRYAIQHNESPSDGVAMRMRIGAGSIAERDEEQGLAHYLEHMAFRGSRNVADGEVVHMLERQGLRFGPDTNAFTSQDETVYMFTFPKADAGALDTGLTLFREIGERLTLAPAAVEAERGVVLSEERLRDTPPYQSVKANFGNILAGTRAVKRWPIGQVETIKGATSERLRRFYQANYRPDNATLVIVGNIDPQKVEAEIKARFADWRRAGEPDHLDPGTPAPARPATEFIAAGAQDSLTMTWVRPVDRRAETEAVDRERLIQLVGLTALNNRLADRAAKPGSPYVVGQAGTIGSLFGTAGLTQIGVAASPDKWRESIDAVVGEQRQLLAQALTPDDLARAVSQLRVMFRNAAETASTRKSPAIADGLVKAANDDELFTSPAQDLELAEPVFASLTPDAVSKGLASVFDGKGPVLFRSAQSGPVTEEALGQQLAKAYSGALQVRAAEAKVVWPYSDFGKPSAITGQRRDKALGATIVSFGNGTRLIVKPTPFNKESISVSVAMGNGRKGTPPELTRAFWAVPLLPVGGTGKLDAGSIDRWGQSNGLLINANIQVGTSAFVLSASTRPKDLTSQMQLLAAYVRDPGFRPELAEKTGSLGKMIAGQIEANAGAVFTREVQRVTSGGDPRWSSVPSPEAIAATRPEDLGNLLRPVLAGPADVTIVGDVTLPDAIAAVRSTFGSGTSQPRAATAEPVVALARNGDAPFIVNHAGRSDQAFFGEFWSLPDYFANPRLSYAADVAGAILQSRLVDIVREKMGLTYSPRVQAVASIDLGGLGYFGAMLETPAGNFDTFRTLLDQQIAELAGKPVSADDLERAKRPLIESRTKDFESNGYWVSSLAMALRNPRTKAPILEQADGIRKVTAADVQALFAGFIKGKAPATVIAKAR